MLKKEVYILLRMVQVAAQAKGLPWLHAYDCSTWLSPAESSAKFMVAQSSLPLESRSIGPVNQSSAMNLIKRASAVITVTVSSGMCQKISCASHAVGELQFMVLSLMRRPTHVGVSVRPGQTMQKILV